MGKCCLVRRAQIAHLRKVSGHGLRTPGGPGKLCPEALQGCGWWPAAHPARARLEEAQGGSHSPCLDCVEGESLALGLAHLGSNPSSATLRLSDRCLGT